MASLNLILPRLHFSCLVLSPSRSQHLYYPCSIFGEARTREEILAARGVDLKAKEAELERKIALESLGEKVSCFCVTKQQEAVPSRARHHCS